MSRDRHQLARAARAAPSAAAHPQLQQRIELAVPARPAAGSAAGTGYLTSSCRCSGVTSSPASAGAQRVDDVALRRRPAAPPCGDRRSSTSRGAASAMLLSSTSTTPASLRTPREPPAPACCRPWLGPVDLGDERRQHRRAGRHFDHLDVGAVALRRSPAAPAARAWRCRGSCGRALCLSTRFTCDVADLAAAAQVILAHQAVEVDRRGGAGIGLVVGDLRHGREVRRRARAARRACRSSGVPAGMSTMTWNSDLLSKGSIFSTTSPAPASASDQRRSARRRAASRPRLRRAAAPVEQRRHDAARRGASMPTGRALPRGRARRACVPAEQPRREPRRDDERDRRATAACPCWR